MIDRVQASRASRFVTTNVIEGRPGRSGRVTNGTAQQLVDAFPDEAAPAYLLRDRDSVYGQAFRHRVKGMGIEEVLTAPQSPWQNPFVERLIGSTGASA